MSDYNYDSLESEAKVIGNAFEIHKMMKETSFNSTILISFFEKIIISYKTYVQDHYVRKKLKLKMKECYRNA